MLIICKRHGHKMSIFSRLDYRENLKTLVENRKKIDSSVTYQRMAEHMRIQKAYLSQVIKGNRDLSQDQLYMAMDYLDLRDHERDFLKLSLEYERSGLMVRKRELKVYLKEMQKKYAKTSAHIEVEEVDHEQTSVDEYYLDPFNLIIHICLGIKSFNQDPKEIAKTLMIPQSKVQDVFKKLEKLGIIKVEKGKIVIQKRNMHIPKESPLFQMWRQNLNQIAQTRINLVSNENKYNFQVVFSAEESVRKEIQEEFMKYLKKVQKLVKEAEAKEMYQMSFDLFSWTQSF